jgi:hypothetical protein
LIAMTVGDTMRRPSLQKPWAQARAIGHHNESI